MKKVFLIILVILIVIQFIQPAHNNGQAMAASDITHVVPVPDSVLSVLKTSCYDCHSNHTEYPWYSKISPVNWWLANHINGGKRSLNFSTFGNYTFKRMGKKLDDTHELIEKGAMPLNSYLWIHKNAVLSEQQKKMLMAWTESAQAAVMQDSLQKLNSTSK